MTPERLAALEAEAARREDGDLVEAVPSQPMRLDEEQSPVAGRRFTRA